MILPVPEHRAHFVGNKIVQRFLAIEHFFSDTVLIRFGLKGDKVVPDSSVFNIRDNNKTTFAKESLDDLEDSEFSNFTLLFQELDKIINDTRA